MSVVYAEYFRPLGPRVVRRTGVRWLWEKLEVDHGAAAVPHGCSNAIRSRITALNTAQKAYVQFSTPAELV